MRIEIRDTTKKNYIIVRDTPDGTVKISGVFTILENAKKEVKARREFKSPDWIKQPDGWGEPYLVEVEVKLKKVEVD